MEKYSVPMSAVDHFIRRERNLAARKKLCRSCDGTGSIFSENPIVLGLHKYCPDCDGLGVAK